MKMDQMKTTHFDKKSLVAPIIIVILLAVAIGLIILLIHCLMNHKKDLMFKNYN